MKHLFRAVRAIEPKLRSRIDAAGEKANVRHLLDETIAEHLSGGRRGHDGAARVGAGIHLVPRGSGRFSIRGDSSVLDRSREEAKRKRRTALDYVNPYTCKGCMECIKVCNDDALRRQEQTPESVAKLRKGWQFWQALPTSDPEFNRIEDLDEKIGALHTLLLDKKNYLGMVGGDGACLGCGEKTVVHLFTATVEALMQPRVAKQIEKVDDLLTRLDRHIRLKLAGTLDLSDSGQVDEALTALRNSDVTLASFSEKLDERHAGATIDPEWLHFATQLLAKLKHLRWQYTEGVSRRGRSNMGMLNSTGCTSVWASTYPFNPYPFPWANHLFQDSPSLAMGIFEGHMSKMADGFKAIRMAELELNGGYQQG